MSNKITILYNSIFNAMEKRSKRFHMILITLANAFIVVIDYFTDDLDFVMFYVVPIFLSTWFVSKTAGVISSTVSCISSFCVNLNTSLSRSTVPHMVWDFTLDISFFILLGFMFWMLRQKYNEINELALRDPLTQLFNRRSLNELAEYQLLASKRHWRPFSVAFFDLDNFKAVNDKAGHHIGDSVLRRVANVMTDTLRSTDMIARIGGDEFVIALPETGSEQAKSVINKVRDALLGAMTSEGWPVTFSIGLVTCQLPDYSWNDLLKRADALMYRVKARAKDGILHEIIGNEPILRPARSDEPFFGIF